MIAGFIALLVCQLIGEFAVRVAVVLHDGPATKGAGGDGWYRESWARCDVSELPDEVAESYFGYQIWTGPDGQPGINGGLVRRMGPNPAPTDPTPVIAYVGTIDIPDIDKSMADVTKAGGTLALPKQAIPS